MQSIIKTIKDLILGKSYNPINQSPESDFSYILKQFELPPKVKTEQDIIRDYTVKMTMHNLEWEMLKLDPSVCFQGFQTWYDHEGNKFFDWVPCVIRPDVFYCSYGKN